MSAVKVTLDIFKNEVMKEERPVLLDFWASWCGPCQMLAPTIEEIAEENPQFYIGKINVDEQPELSEAFSIVSIPTLVFMKNGKIVAQTVGGRSKEQILEMLDEI